MRKFRVIVIAAILSALLSACAGLEPTPITEAPALRFTPTLTMCEEGKVHFEIGSPTTQPGKFQGQRTSTSGQS